MDNVIAIIFLAALIGSILGVRTLIGLPIHVVKKKRLKSNPRTKKKTLSTRLYFFTPTSSPEMIQAALLYRFGTKSSGTFNHRLKLIHEQVSGEYYSLSFRYIDNNDESFRTNVLIRPGTGGNGTEGRITLVKELTDGIIDHVDELGLWYEELITSIYQTDHQTVFTQS